ncbi:MAG: hypothetical protein COB01_11755 [Lutibacter sp.]|nr:MAG: hypothetical protein COB01_11755 [Lutibacter sp.]
MRRDSDKRAKPSRDIKISPSKLIYDHLNTLIVSIFILIIIIIIIIIWVCPIEISEENNSILGHLVTGGFGYVIGSNTK